MFNGCVIIVGMKNKDNTKNIIQLFLTFLKIGAFTFGGGYAMIALIEREFVERKKWIDHEEFLDMTAIAESTPGPIAINSATFIGYKVSGVWGAIVSTLAVSLPSLVIIFTISLFFDKFLENKYIAAAFKGIQVCVCYLILAAGIKLFGKMKKNALSMTLFVMTVVAMLIISFFAVKFSSIFLILIGAIIGISVWLIGKLTAGKEEKR